MQIAGAWAWRIVAIAAVGWVLMKLIIEFKLIVIPFFVAILLSALLIPFVNFLVRHKWPRWLGILTAMLTLLGVVTGLVVLIVTQIRSSLPDLQEKTGTAIDDLKASLEASPFNITDKQIDTWIEEIQKSFSSGDGSLINGALNVGSSAGHFLTGFLLVLFATIFLLIDGRGVWKWVVGLFPRKARTAINGAGQSGWLTLTTFVKVQIFVAAVDAVGIGLGAWIIGLFYGGFPLVIPIAIAVFLGSFVPVVGALVSGVVAIFIALVYLGPVPALLMLGVVLLVQQIEGHVLQPLVLGSAVKVHPLAVVFAVAGGGLLAGIPGTLFAVPIVATVNVMVKYIASGTWRHSPDLLVEPKKLDS